MGPGPIRTTMSMRASRVRTCHIMSFMAHLASGYEKVSFSRKDMDNKIMRYEEVQLANADASKAIGYLTHKVDNDIGFYAKYTFDEYYGLENLIWADSQSQRDYKFFSHAIAFDSTYKTNDYGKPLLIIVGINHHFRSTILAYAILVNEILETYKWIIESFIHCMKEVQPETVLTDGDLAMKAAVAELMPNASHRICTWHIGTNATKRVKDPNFGGRLNRVMLRYYTESRFEMEWATLVKDFRLENHSWVHALYKCRHLWAETYVRGAFFGGMTTTQRSKSMNAFVKRNLSIKVKLSDFVRLLDQCLCKNRQIEAKEDYDSAHSLPVPGSMNMLEIEGQATKTYTRTIFFKVRDEIRCEGRYLPSLEGNKIEGRLFFKIKKYGGSKGEDRYVTVDVKENKFLCTCNKFGSDGMPCRHMFAMMKVLGIKKIPNSLILTRWTKEAKGGIRNPFYSSNNKKDNKLDEAGRFGHFLARCTAIAQLTAKNEVVWDITNEQMDKLEAVVGKAWTEYEGNGIEATEKEIDPTDGESIPLRNPVVTKTKGAPRTRTMGIRRPRKCSSCKRFGHNKSTCMRKRTTQTVSHSISNSEQSSKDYSIDLNADSEWPWENEAYESRCNVGMETANNDASRSPLFHNMSSTSYMSTSPVYGMSSHTNTDMSTQWAQSSAPTCDDSWWPQASFPGN